MVLIELLSKPQSIAVNLQEDPTQALQRSIDKQHLLPRRQQALGGLRGGIAQDLDKIVGLRLGHRAEGDEAAHP
jgi:hypothetical protein